MTSEPSTQSLRISQQRLSSMSCSQKHDVLGVQFDLADYQMVMETVRRWKTSGERRYIVLTPPHSVLMCHSDADLRQATACAGMTLPDGVGIIVAADVLRYPHHGRVTGPTLMLKLCEWGRDKDLSHYFYGGQEGTVERLVDRLHSLFPGLRVVGTYSPPFRRLTPTEDDQAVRRINSSKPDVVWVGLGSPRQEKWMADHVRRINATALIGVGAAFDFHSGRIPWAPAWIRRAGLEWAYRLAKEPRRMWRRNLDSPVFLTKVIAQRLRPALGAGKGGCPRISESEARNR